MSFIRTLNKKLNKVLHGQVSADEDGGCLVLSGALERWSDVVLACKMAVEKSPYSGFINNIECVGEKQVPIRKPKVEDSALEWEEPDVLIIGGGVIGCAIARELTKYKLSVLIVEKEHDVAMQASGRNLGVVQSGVGLKKGSMRYKFCRQGNAMYANLCSELEVDFMHSGQYVYLAKRLWDSFLSFTLIYWKWLGIKGVKKLGRDELAKYEPGINKNIGAALRFPASGVVHPFDLTIALAENAVQNGAVLSLNTLVTSISSSDGVIKSVDTNRGTIKPKVVVNAAGVFSESIAAMAGDRFFSIRPVKGTAAVLDRKATSGLIQTVITSRGLFSKKKKHCRDASVVRSVYGSVLIGPDTFETMHKEDYTTTPQNLKDVVETAKRTVPEIDEGMIITYFSGIQAATFEDDFIIEKGRYISNIIHAAGIQTPGLTAAPAIGVEVAKLVLDSFGGESTVGLNNEFDPVRIAPTRPSQMDVSARAALIESNPDYGIIICRCEEISKGEVIAALRRNVRCDSIDGVKRRVRPGMGCCHGSYCTPLVLDIISSDKRLAPHNVRKSGSGSEKLYGLSKTILQNKELSFFGEFGKNRTDPETAKRLQARAIAMMTAHSDRKDTDINADE
ncbi:MAG: NAD(P)/FAD-dependent oxidoreductase [Oscillospiraceae bacterium]|nr:NAD(P)/FAD-dependent oxidoreductase [Oscillospiraceae bacterium]